MNRPPLKSKDGKVWVKDVLSGTPDELREKLKNWGGSGYAHLVDEAHDMLNAYVEKNPLQNHIVTPRELVVTPEGEISVCVIGGFGAPSAMYGYLAVLFGAVNAIPVADFNRAINYLTEQIAIRAFRNLLNPNTKCACCGKEAR